MSDPFDSDCGFEGDEDEVQVAAAGNPMEGVAPPVDDRVTEAQDRAAVAEARVADLNDTIRYLNATISDLNARNVELERARTAAEFRASAAEARVADADRLHAATVDDLKGEILALKFELEDARMAAAASSSSSVGGGAAASSSGPEPLSAVPSIPVHIQSKLQSILAPQRLTFWTSTLLYSMSRDGPTAAAWHAAVDGVPRLLTLIRVKEFWFGAYTAVGFGGARGSKSDSSAFMFTLTNPHGVPPTAFKVKGDGQDALYQYAEYGPYFNGGMSIASLFDHNVKSYVSFTADYYDDTTGKGVDTFHMEGRVDKYGFRTGWTVTDMYSFKL